MWAAADDGTHYNYSLFCDFEHETEHSKAVLCVKERRFRPFFLLFFRE
jgi:hypothetical protein